MKQPLGILEVRPTLRIGKSKCNQGVDRIKEHLHIRLRPTRNFLSTI
jgi:hypothetical protein